MNDPAQSSFWAEVLPRIRWALHQMQLEDSGFLPGDIDDLAERIHWHMYADDGALMFRPDHEAERRREAFVVLSSHE